MVIIFEAANLLIVITEQNPAIHGKLVMHQIESACSKKMIASIVVTISPIFHNLYGKIVQPKRGLAMNDRLNLGIRVALRDCIGRAVLDAVA